jgi:hypothetical protein
MLKSTESYLVNIIRSEMALDEQQIWVRNQDRKFPNTKGLFIVVGMSDAQTISNKSECIPTDEGMTEIQQVQVREIIQIDLMSENNDALERRWEVLAAIQSVYSEQVQETNNFKIFKASQGFINTSSAEGGSQINRFTLSIACHVWYRKEKPLDSINGDYYNDFDTRVDDEKTIGEENGIIEFNIAEA